MHIKEVIIENYKVFKGRFSLELKDGTNILVGNNEVGKSTILEAIHLALTGLINGRYLKVELTQHLFNNDIVAEYLENLKLEGSTAPVPPHILIEIYIEGDAFPQLEGDGHSKSNIKECGIVFEISLKDALREEYDSLVKTGELKSLPIEYYDFSWSSFAREVKTPRTIPLKSALIDSASRRYQNGSDVYISHIVRDLLAPEDVISISQAHRKLKDAFADDSAVKSVNTKLCDATEISQKNVRLGVDMGTKNAWENTLTTHIGDVPFHHIGKGEQCIVKTKLALSHKKSKEANVLLLEEPENHLSHTRLNRLLKDINEGSSEKQLIISTHSSFVANKLGLDNLILLSNGLASRLDSLKPSTKSFFQKLSGYDTLRLVLCKKAILVEGDSDELVIQKAYMIKCNGKLPIEDEIDVISVGTSFLRFLEIAEKIQHPVVVVTDNDGDIEAVKRKYSEYMGEEKKAFVRICFDETVDEGDLVVGEKKFNYNTLEPKMLKANSLGKMNSILEKAFESENELYKYMNRNKTECALKIFDTDEDIDFPGYVSDAIAEDEDE